MYRRKTKLEMLSENHFYLSAVFILSGLCVMFCVLLLFSLLMTKMDLPDAAVSVFSIVSIAAGSFVTGFRAGKQKRKNGLLTGFMHGIVLFFLLLLIGLPIVREGISFLLPIKLAVILLFSAIGGIKGVNTRLHFLKRY